MIDVSVTVVSLIDGQPQRLRTEMLCRVHYNRRLAEERYCVSGEGDSLANQLLRGCPIGWSIEGYWRTEAWDD